MNREANESSIEANESSIEANESKLSLGTKTDYKSALSCMSHAVNTSEIQKPHKVCPVLVKAKLVCNVHTGNHRASCTTRSQSKLY